ncbi:trigger factor [[Clostridium] fimetarium]|uniref:peptidylprolyl isomerase n=1 Tax=[Clostridium] fimetarium TaxID=99656 RepID=A0A1I0P2A0_9FIRM|nr:trigger factor [[Clostridium] fimetarium]SEW08364.1 trigger factor [[Clostridium] fimetarium]
MKKKLLSVFLVITMVLSVTACGKTTTENPTTAAVLTYQEQLAADQQNYAQYVTLGQYTGIEVKVDRSTLEVTDQAVQEYINGILTENATTTTVTTGTTKSGDAVVLDYSGLLDGTAFSGGTATDATYTIGSAKFITELDQGLIGLEVGKQYDLPITFPADYSSTDLAGKSVIFRVTVTAINESTPAQYTDAFVQSVAANYKSTATTTADFTVFAKQSLVEQAKTTFDNTKYSSIWTTIAANCTVSGYPDAEVQTLMDTIENNVKSEFASKGSSYGITDYATYLKSVYNYATEQDFLDYAKDYSQNYLKEKMILTMIAQKENITVTDDQIAEMGAQLATYYGYDSFQQIIETYGASINLEVGYSVLSDSIIKFLLEKSVEK